MGFLVGYDTALSSVTFYVNEDRFPCYNGKDADYVPDPIVDYDAFNRNLRFSANNPGFVDVDWGDGTKDQYPFVKISDGSYRIVFRSLDIEYKKNPDDTTWWYRKEDGSQYIPVPPHKYSDIRRRAVTMRFSNVIDGEFNMNGIVLHEFPIINLPDITYLAMTRSVLKNGDIPYDRISKSVNLRNIQMGTFSHSGVWSNWPEGFLNMKDLRYFGCNDVFNFGDDPDSNWRRFSEWKNLTEFNFNWCNIPSYDPAFNSIPAKGINIISNRNNIPVFDEEDQVIVVLLFYIILKMDNMNRNDIIKELGSYFDIVELVCPHTYNKWKDRSWQFLDTVFLHNLLILRRDIIKQPMYCNNWDKQGQFSQRGLRCNICQIVKDKKDVYLSAHVLGKAGDFDVKSMTAEQARGLILDHQDMLPYPFRLEGKVGWLHFDSLDTRNGIHAVVF